jgi:tetratricopeptide (TPR) repeat protein
LTQPKVQYLEAFAEAADRDLLDQLFRLRADKAGRWGEAEPGAVPGEEMARSFLHYYGSPFPEASDLDRPDVEYSRLAHYPLALAFELSRRNLAGIWLFRFRRWTEAGEAFSEVERILQEAMSDSESGRLHTALLPLYHEASLYLGRLAAQRCEFAEAEDRITNALGIYRALSDEFAENKARRYLAELKYRQLDWVSAESHFVQVLETSRERGFDHDAAVAEMFLGKILSRFGFQGEAIVRLERANDHFRRYEGFRETFECLFWLAAAHNRRRHWRESAKGSRVAARALVDLYSSFYCGIERLSSDRSIQADHPEWKPALKHLSRSLAYERHPSLLEAMLCLRQRRLPERALVAELARLARSHRARYPWQSAAQAQLCGQLLRLVRLQRGGSPPKAWLRGISVDASEPVSPELKKFWVRSCFISAFEEVVFQRRWDPRAICAHLHETFRRREELDLRGGFVPSLVDVMQFFADRGAFVAILVLMQRALDEVISELEGRRPGQRSEPPFDAEALKAIYRSITKYLVLERNLYLSRPAFESAGSAESDALWRALESRKPDDTTWDALFDAGILGGCGLWYPPPALGLGWVDSLGDSSATVRVLWFEDHRGHPIAKIREESFEAIEIPLETIRAGHAESFLAPILLIGRIGELDTSRGRWVAHHLPDLDVDRLFKEADNLAGYAPRIAAWRNLYASIGGEESFPDEGMVIREAEVRRRMKDSAQKWFAGRRLPDGMFEELFGLAEVSPDEQAVQEAIDGARIEWRWSLKRAAKSDIPGRDRSLVERTVVEIATSRLPNDEVRPGEVEEVYLQNLLDENLLEELVPERDEVEGVAHPSPVPLPAGSSTRVN